MCNYKLMARYPDGQEKVLQLQSTREISTIDAPGAVELVVRPAQDLSPEGMFNLYRSLRRLDPEQRLDSLQKSTDGEWWLRRLQEVGAAWVDENGYLAMKEGLDLLKAMIDAGCNVFVPVSRYTIGQNTDCIASALTLSSDHCQEVVIDGDEFRGLFWFPQEIVPSSAVLQTSGQKAQVPLRFRCQDMYGTWCYSGQILNKVELGGQSD